MKTIPVSLLLTTLAASVAVNVVWTITILPDVTGSKVIFDEVANGSDASNLDKIAGAVDTVKAEAMGRLVADD